MQEAGREYAGRRRRWRRRRGGAVESPGGKDAGEEEETERREQAEEFTRARRRRRRRDHHRRGLTAAQDQVEGEGRGTEVDVLAVHAGEPRERDALRRVRAMEVRSRPTGGVQAHRRRPYVGLVP